MQSQIPAPTPAQTIVQQVSKFGRRPLIQVVVIYASNQKVMAYSQKVSEKLIASGIDVIIQTTPNNAPKSRTKVNDIMTEHMADIIVTSHADFLVVIGDRNMKNKSVHSKRKGKLIEMKIPDMQMLIWKSWPQNPHKNYVRIQNLSVEQLEELLLQYTGITHVKERIDTLRENVDKFTALGWCNPKNEVARFDDNVKTEIVGFQKISVRLHKQMKLAHIALCELKQTELNLETSKGSFVNIGYKPNAPRTPSNTIAPLLQFKLSRYLLEMMKEVEDNCDVLGEERLSVWKEYFEEHKAQWKPAVIAEPPPPPPVEEGQSVDLPSYYEAAPAEAEEEVTVASPQVDVTHGKTFTPVLQNLTNYSSLGETQKPKEYDRSFPPLRTSGKSSPAHGTANPSPNPNPNPNPPHAHKAVGGPTSHYVSGYVTQPPFVPPAPRKAEFDMGSDFFTFDRPHPANPYPNPNPVAKVQQPFDQRRPQPSNYALAPKAPQDPRANGKTVGRAAPPPSPTEDLSRSPVRGRSVRSNSDPTDTPPGFEPLFPLSFSAGVAPPSEFPDLPNLAFPPPFFKPNTPPRQLPTPATLLRIQKAPIGFPENPLNPNPKPSKPAAIGQKVASPVKKSAPVPLHDEFNGPDFAPNVDYESKDFRAIERIWETAEVPSEPFLLPDINSSFSRSSDEPKSRFYSYF